MLSSKRATILQSVIILETRMINPNGLAWTVDRGMFGLIVRFPLTHALVCSKLPNKGQAAAVEREGLSLLRILSEDVL